MVVSAGEGGERVPADCVRRRRGPAPWQVVDGGLVLVGDVGVFGDPEEIRRHQPGERGAVLLLGDFAELLAEGVEARIVQRRRQRDGDRLVGPGRRRRRGCAGCWRACAWAWPDARARARPRARAQSTKSIEDRRECRIAISPRFEPIMRRNLVRSTAARSGPKAIPRPDRVRVAAWPRPNPIDGRNLARRRVAGGQLFASAKVQWRDFGQCLLRGGRGARPVRRKSGSRRGAMRAGTASYDEQRTLRLHQNMGAPAAVVHTLAGRLLLMPFARVAGDRDRRRR